MDGISCGGSGSKHKYHALTLSCLTIEPLYIIVFITD